MTPSEAVPSTLSHYMHPAPRQPLMNSDTPSTTTTAGTSCPLPPPTNSTSPYKLRICQHNCLHCWDVFLSLFHSFGSSPPQIIALQDPPSRRRKLPAFPGFISLTETSPGPPKVAFYVSLPFNQATQTFIQTLAPGLAILKVSASQGLLSQSSTTLHVINGYSTSTAFSPYRTLSPANLFLPSQHPTLVLGDFNLHHPLPDPMRNLTTAEFSLSSQYFSLASDRGFSLLNTPVVFVTGPPGPRNLRAPVPIPCPAPAYGLGRGLFLSTPRPSPRPGPRPVYGPGRAPVP